MEAKYRLIQTTFHLWTNGQKLLSEQGCKAKVSFGILEPQPLKIFSELRFTVIFQMLMYPSLKFLGICEIDQILEFLISE